MTEATIGQIIAGMIEPDASDPLPWPLLVCPSCRTGARTWVIGTAADSSRTCANPACGEQYSRLTPGIPVVAAAAARHRIAELDGCGPLPQAGMLAEWIGQWEPGTLEFGSLGRAAIYLDAMQPEGESSFYGELCEALLAGLDELPGNTLDVGCGLGNLTFELARRLPGQFLGLDLDAHLLRWAERLVGGGKIEIPVRRSAGRFGVGTLPAPDVPNPGRLKFIAGNLLNPPFADASFRLVTLVNVLDQVGDPARALRRAAAMVQSGGYLLFAQPDSWNAGSTPPERWLAEDKTEWDAVFARMGLETVRNVDDLEWVLVDAPRLRHVYRVHGRLLRKGR